MKIVEDKNENDPCFFYLVMGSNSNVKGKKKQQKKNEKEHEKSKFLSKVFLCRVFNFARKIVIGGGGGGIGRVVVIQGVIVRGEVRVWDNYPRLGGNCPGGGGGVIFQGVVVLESLHVF